MVPSPFMIARTPLFARGLFVVCFAGVLCCSRELEMDLSSVRY